MDYPFALGDRVVIVHSEFQQPELRVGQLGTVFNLYGPGAVGVQADSGDRLTSAQDGWAFRPEEIEIWKGS